jgi:hypothetical protein
MRLAFIAWALTLSRAPHLPAQGLPPWRPINPIVTSRSILGFIPLVDRESGWKVDTFLDYGSLVEFTKRDHAQIVLDAEVLRLETRVGRWIGRKTFVQAKLGLWGAYAGFLDPILNRYHRLLGVDQQRRNDRPNDVFDYGVLLPDGTTVVRDRTGTALADVGVSVGVRHNENVQTTLTVGLPVSTGPPGYGLEAVAVGVVTTARSNLIGRLRLEASGGLGFSPTAGELEAWQREVMVAASAGGRFRFWGRQSIYANVFYHSPLYHSTTLPAMDAGDVSLDAGLLLRPSDGGPELVAGVVEDVYSVGPAVDLVIRLGVRW